MEEYISRNELLAKQYESEGTCGLSTMVVDVRDIEDAPAADVVPVVRGEWIPARIVIDDYMGRWKKANQCSVCDGYFSKRFAFCPACGDRMDKEATT